uniref:ATP synthase complex subunit 8 n=1 Tax=Aphrophora maritima TaxID=868254 RepID=A0A343X9M9_9HEMI|nr:ATP synthase F0 subunit 8 [Aphrophora maritima]
MPQMAPMYWTFLFTLFILLFIMFNMMIYFIFMTNKMKLYKKLYYNQMNWKW